MCLSTNPVCHIQKYIYIPPALLGGVLNDRLGRKFVTILASLIFTVGAGLLGAAQNVETLVAGRLVVGLGIGFASMTVPVYIAESAPGR